MTTATKASLQRVAEASWRWLDAKETKPNAGQTSANFKAGTPRCPHDGCTKYAIPRFGACTNHAKHPCIDCGAPVSLSSKRCKTCGPRYAARSRA